MVDLTELILENRGPLADPLIAAAGTDVSHWFSLLPSPPDGKKSKTKGGLDGGKSGNRAPFTKTAIESGGDGSGDVRLDEGQNVGDPRTFVDPHTGLTVPYLPMGRWVGWLRHIARQIEIQLPWSPRCKIVCYISPQRRGGTGNSRHSRSRSFGEACSRESAANRLVVDALAF